MLRIFGIELVRSSEIETLKLSRERGAPLFKILDSDCISIELRTFLLLNQRKSQGQLNQDLIAQYIHIKLGRQSPGFFVEFGATDGIDLSNTLLLERDFGWTGLLIEPARIWHESLVANRRCVIDFRCISNITGEHIAFWEAEEPAYSSISAWKEFDYHSHLRSKGKQYTVESVSLNDLLLQHGIIGVIDYLSIDTEGSEYEILRNFDFQEFSFNFISVEHNFNANREEIFKLLTANGYVRKFEEFSLFDDWYFSEIGIKAFN